MAKRWHRGGNHPGQAGFYELTAVGRNLYFATVNYSASSQLWRSNGTEAGTSPIASLGVTPEGCYCGLEITGYPLLTNVGGALLQRNRRAVAHGWHPERNEIAAKRSPARPADRRRAHALLRRHR